MTKEIEKLTKAVERRKGKLTWYGPTIKHTKNDPEYSVSWKTGEEAGDVATMLSNLPYLYLDNQKFMKLIESLLSVIIQQQIQIDEMKFNLEEIARANIAIKAQKNMHDILLKLAGQGSNVKKPEITIKFSAASNYESDKNTKNKNFESRSSEIKVDIDAAFKHIYSMNLGIDFEKSDANKKFTELNESTKIIKGKKYGGDVNIKFDSITGAPMAKAKAKILASHIDSQQRINNKEQ